jgi:hypothetical protein
MRKFFSDLIPQPYLPVQQQQDSQVIPINSELETVLTADDNHPQYGSQDEPAKTPSWGAKIQDTLARLEKKTEPFKSDYRKWTFYTIGTMTLTSLVPPATYVILSKLNDYVSYPVRHTAELIRLTSQLQAILPVFEPIQRAYRYLSNETNTRFWNLIKVQGADYRQRDGSFLLNNCFWQQCHQIYPNDNFIFPAEFKNYHLSCGADAPDLFWHSQFSGSKSPGLKYPGLICDYFLNHPLIQTNRTPSFEYCQSNLYDMCGNLTKLQEILPDYESLSKQVLQLENEIDAQGGNYNLISKGVFWCVWMPVSLLSMAGLGYLAYSHYKIRQDLKTKMDLILNGSLQLDEQETKDMGEIVNFLNQVIPGANPLALEQKTSVVINRLKDRGRILNNYQFFKVCDESLPKELTEQILGHLIALETSAGVKKPALTM